MHPSTVERAAIEPAAAERTTSFGQDYTLTWVDRFGVWLSSRQVRRYLPDVRGMRIGDFGCGYNASLARTWIDVAAAVTLVDVSLAPDLKRHSSVHAIEGSLPDALSNLASGSLDAILCLSVLEHVWRPVELLKECHRTLAPGGICLINVPSWHGKGWLEFSAFKLGLSPREEMDDHKCYYDPRDLWPILVRAGFKPCNIRCFKHKFGLNTFAVCRRVTTQGDSANGRP